MAPRRLLLLTAVQTTALLHSRTPALRRTVRRATDDQEPSLARELSQSAVALAAGIDGPFSKYDPIRNAALKKIRTRFTPNELADVVNAYAEAGVKAPDLFETVSDALRERLSSFTADDACDVAFALSRARCVSDELLDAVATHANTTATSAEALARLCYAFARKGVRRGPGAATAARNARQAVEKGGTLSLDSLSRCCWASAAIQAILSLSTLSRLHEARRLMRERVHALTARSPSRPQEAHR